ncbi:AAA family ATPase [Catenisphaera adipataccumulans]|jgi:cytidylate kinase|uniref:Cytidylate kinase n=1 Tax=Catenisphaera adipataccumulans TaxID=700500 RepID=A0A7W8CWD1_9FIRM|nr:cytidylate kinase-like family protein [Catenisphaera adipataccumulans]MBB5182551.1 cytidylate kinase [Catenisphaera adipataccumulans]
MKYNVITITREFGSGGRTIAKELAARLGYSYYDYNLVQKIAEQSNFSRQYIEEHGEDASQSGWFAFAWNNYGGGLSDQLYVAQRNVITNLAEQGRCIIVGRCADYILRERTDTFHAFIYADRAFRQKRIVDVYGESDESIESRVEKKDRRRITYYRYYTDRKWGQAKYYDVCLNSGHIGIDMCCDLIERMVK